MSRKGIKPFQGYLDELLKIKSSDELVISNLQHENRKKDAEINILTKRIDRMHFRRGFSAADYDKENEKFESENTLLKNYNEKLEQGIKNDRIIYEAERDGLNVIISTLKKENEDLIQTIKDKENEALQMIDNHNMQIRKYNDEMEDERKNVTNKINGFKSTINDLIKKNSELEISKENVLNAAANFERQIKKLEQEFKDIKNGRAIKESNSGSVQKFNEIFGDLDKYVFLKDAVINTKLDYKCINDKYLVAKNVFCTLKQGYWQVCSTLDSNETPLNLALNKKFKLHLNGRLSIFFGQAHVSTLLKHVSSCNLMKLQLGSQTITWTEYLKLVSSQTLKIVEFKKCIINDNEGNAIEYEKVLKELPNIEEFEIIFNDKEVTEKTTKMFSQIQQFSNLKKFCAGNLPESFDFKAFSAFIKRHPTVEFQLFFKKQIPKNAQKLIFQTKEKYLDKSFKIFIEFA